MLERFVDYPIFISGFNKSGTTLFLSLLDSHPELAVFPEELHFCKNVLFAKNKIEALKKKTGFRHFLPGNCLKEWSQGKSWFKEGYPEFDKAFFAEKISKINEDSNPFDILRHVIQEFTIADGMSPINLSGWVSKTTQNELYFPVLQKLFGGRARFVYVVRDPRDVYLSYSKRMQIDSAINITNKYWLFRFIIGWKEQVKYVLSLQESKENILILRYEDLVQDTESMMVKASRFFGITWMESLMVPTRNNKIWFGNSVFTDTLSGVSSSPVGRYKSRLDKETIKIINDNLFELMQKFEYSINSNIESAKRLNFSLFYKYYCLFIAARYRAKLLYLKIRS